MARVNRALQFQRKFKRRKRVLRGDSEKCGTASTQVSILLLVVKCRRDMPKAHALINNYVKPQRLICSWNRG